MKLYQIAGIQLNNGTETSSPLAACKDRVYATLDAAVKDLLEKR